MIKTIFFDIGNVLVFFSLQKMISQLSTCLKVQPTWIEREFLQSNLREQYEKGHIQTEELYEIFKSKSKKDVSLLEFKDAFSNIFTPNQSLTPLIESLKAKNIELILLSNTSACHFEFLLHNYSFLQLFDKKVLSYEHGVWKPDPQIFQYALTIASHCPNECFYTDDIPEFVHSARKVGLPAEIYSTTENLKNHLKSGGIYL
jgi:FMN phosphatase YigB (HAD superfamily)